MEDTRKTYGVPGITEFPGFREAGDKGRSSRPMLFHLPFQSIFYPLCFCELYWWALWTTSVASYSLDFWLALANGISWQELGERKESEVRVFIFLASLSLLK